MFQMSQTNSQLPVPNDHRYTQNIQDIISHINNNKQILKKELAIAILGFGFSFILTKVILEWLDNKEKKGGNCKLAGY